MNKKLIFKYSLFDLFINFRNLILAIILISISIYITMLFIGVGDIFADYSDSEIWSMPKNITIKISQIEENEKYFDEQFLEYLNKEEKIESLQVHYNITKIKKIKFNQCEQVYTNGSACAALNSSYSVFNAAYRNYVLKLEQNFKDIIYGTGFIQNDECQVMISRDLCMCLCEEAGMNFNKMEDIIGQYIYITNVEGKEIPIKIVGVYNNLLTSTNRNHIDRGYDLISNSVIKEYSVIGGSSLLSQDFLFNEISYKLIEGVQDEIVNIEYIEVVLKDYNYIKKFCLEIEEKYGFNVVTEILELEYQIQLIKKIRYILIGLIVFVSLIAIVIVIDSLSIIISKKKKNIAILNAVGIQKKTIKCIYCLEFAFIGTASYMASYILSYYTMKLLVYSLRNNEILVNMNFWNNQFILLYFGVLFLINCMVLITLQRELDKSIIERIKD